MILHFNQLCTTLRKPSFPPHFSYHNSSSWQSPSPSPGVIMRLTYSSGSLPFLLVPHITTPHIANFPSNHIFILITITIPIPITIPISTNLKSIPIPITIPHPQPSRSHYLSCCQSLQVMAVVPVKGSCCVYHDNFAFPVVSNTASPWPCGVVAETCDLSIEPWWSVYRGMWYVYRAMCCVRKSM